MYAICSVYIISKTFFLPGAFFIPYLFFLIFGAAPVLVLEIGLGQYMQLGGYGAWNICPLFQGICLQL